MKRTLSMAFIATLFSAATAQTTVTFQVSNPSKAPRTDVPVIIPLEAGWGPVATAIVSDGQKEIPCQLDDLDQDGTFDELCFLVKEKNKHNNFIESITARGDCANSYNIQHHHGVDFESELNGIRIYFDQRQTIDLYGKYQKRLELEATQFYTSKEQKAEGYGDDVLWVGNTFGLGAFRGWDGQQPTMIAPVRSRTQRVISYGPLRTIVEVFDRGWKADKDKAPLNMTIRYTQYAGHRDTDVDVIFDKNVADYTFSTGIINVKDSEEFSDKKGLRACWGCDWPSSDHENFKPETVGLGIWIPQQYIKSEEPSNKDNYAFVLRTNDNHLSYKIIYCSDNESFGYHSAQEWFGFLKDWRALEIEQPVKITRVK